MSNFVRTNFVRTKFIKNLTQGHKYEKIALNYLEYDNVEHMEGYFKEYDFILDKNDVKIKIEVKSDRQASITNNLCIEYESNKKPSGISCSTADFWMYFIVFPTYDECYKIPIEDLREIVKSCRKVNGGDNYLSKMYLLNKKLVNKYLISPIIKTL